MLERSAQRIARRLADSDVVLDIGGWANPFPRADWVLDLMPYESRGLYEREGWIEAGASEPERFDASTWIQRDICDREPYPFADDEIDFVVCAQTLEDVRDPVWVCAEMARIARAGYIEVPSRREEQTYGFMGPFAGWPHHHWLVDVGESAIEFVFKPHDLHAHPESHFPAGYRERLTEEERVQELWWEGSFEHRERVFVEESVHDEYLPGFVARELRERPAPPAPARPGTVRRGLRRLRQLGP
jgi:hypothetical protein